MITMTTPTLGLTLPAYGPMAASSDAAVRALPAMGAVAADRAVAQAWIADTTFVCGKDRITDGVVVADGFAPEGTSVWSPPI